MNDLLLEQETMMHVSGPETVVEPGAEPSAAPDAADQEELSPGEGWAVVLFNDDVNEMFYVVGLIMKATGFSADRAYHIMMTAHTRGKALVTITDKVTAERIASVLKTGGLTVELKPVR